MAVSVRTRGVASRLPYTQPQFALFIDRPCILRDVFDTYSELIGTGGSIFISPSDHFHPEITVEYSEFLSVVMLNG